MGANIGSPGSLLLGLLGEPLTPEEIERIVNEALVRYDTWVPDNLPVYGDGRAALTELAEGGPDLVRGHLQRLATLGYVRRVGDRWAQRPVAEWP